jgi:hypothetical protein
MRDASQKNVDARSVILDFDLPIRNLAVRESLGNADRAQPQSVVAELVTFAIQRECHAALTKHPASSGYQEGQQSLQLRARSFGTKVPQDYAP